jgi:hypothetical protein
MQNQIHISKFKLDNAANLAIISLNSISDFGFAMIFGTSSPLGVYICGWWAISRMIPVNRKSVIRSDVLSQITVEVHSFVQKGRT